MASLQHVIRDLEASGQLLRIDEELPANLELAEIQRRVYLSGGPALLFTRVQGCQFPMVSNLFGTLARAQFIFRNSYESVRRAIELKVDPERALRNPLRYWSAPLTAWRMRPKLVRSGPILQRRIGLRDLPQLK